MSVRGEVLRIENVSVALSRIFIAGERELVEGTSSAVSQPSQPQQHVTRITLQNHTGAALLVSQ